MRLLQSSYRLSVHRCSVHFSSAHRFSITAFFSKLLILLLCWVSISSFAVAKPERSERVKALLQKMTLEEKIGQLQQYNLEAPTLSDIPEATRKAIKSGEVSSFLNVNVLPVVNELQRIAVEESRLGIPLLIARDVIHGYDTIFPIPLAQAASWNPDLVEKGAEIAAREAAANGIRWTFAPMLDISRDARWGRIAESFGEDPYLTGVLAAASVKGYQGDDLSSPDRIAATAKHFIGYGAAEAGRDYNTTYIPTPLLENVYLPPFEATIEAGVASVMSAFNDLNGIPASIHRPALDGLLREHLGFDGVVVSDWESVIEAVVHGAAEDSKDAAYKAALANLDIEMVSTTYQHHLFELIREGKIPESHLDQMVARVLTLKEKLGLFDTPFAAPQYPGEQKLAEHRQTALALAEESLVLLKNEGSVLPLNVVQKIALIGPMADAAHDQMGTWVFDGDKADSVTVIQAMESYLGQKSSSNKNLRYERTLKHSRDTSEANFKKAIKAAKWADVVVFIAGEEAALSGEAHSRADIRLPGAQEALVEALKSTGKPLVVVLISGRPNTLHSVLPSIDSLVVAWHPGHQAGPAITNLLYGEIEPVGRLPVTWPKVVGQLPMYYNHKNTGRPPESRPFVLMKDYPEEANQHSLGHATSHIDIGYLPEYPFGFGLTYSHIDYGKTFVDKASYAEDDTIRVSAAIKNLGKRQAIETVQLYIQDVAGSVTRPVRELKGFQRIALAPGEAKQVEISLKSSDFMFYNAQGNKVFEPGQFRAWLAPHARGGISAEFSIK